VASFLHDRVVDGIAGTGAEFFRRQTNEIEVALGRRERLGANARNSSRTCDARNMNMPLFQKYSFDST
jgi:hypothetical protein